MELQALHKNILYQLITIETSYNIYKHSPACVIMQV